MIVIIGETYDDVLYFHHKMEVSSSFKTALGDTGYRGYYGTEEVVVAPVGASNFVSSMVVADLVSRFEPYLVFSTGMVVSLKKELQQGDVFVADRYYLSGVDFSGTSIATYGQLPGQPVFFLSESELNSSATNAAYELGGIFVMRGFLLSGNKTSFEEQYYDTLLQKHFVANPKIVAYDTNSIGIALACKTHNVALLTIKVVGYLPGHPEQTLSYRRKALEAMPTVARIFTRMLVAKGRP